MTTPPLEVLYEDNHLLVVNKPAGLPTMGAPGGAATLLTLAKDYVKRRCQKPGNVYLGVMSRLDAPVTGVVLLGADLEGRGTDDRAVPCPRGREALLGLGRRPLDPAQRRVCRLAGPRRASPPRADRRRGAAGGQGRPASTTGNCRSLGDVSLVEVELETGRKHQIRVQLAHHGHPLVGDRKYGSRRPFCRGHCPARPATGDRPSRAGRDARVSRRRCRGPGPISGFADDLAGRRTSVRRLRVWPRRVNET